MKKNYLNKKIILLISCVVVAVTSLLIYSANHFYPKGNMYQTDNVLCINDDRGPCGNEYDENLNELQVPGWVKFFKGSSGFFVWFVSIVVCLMAYIKFSKIIESENILSNNKKQKMESEDNFSLNQMIDNASPEEKLKIYKEIQKYYGLSDEVMFGKNNKK